MSAINQTQDVIVAAGIPSEQFQETALQKKLIQAEDQIKQKSKENFIQKFNEKIYKKNFQLLGEGGKPSKYPLFSQHSISHAVGRPLSFYGEDTIAHEDTMIDALEIRKEEAEVQLAITIVQKEERQKQSYNRFKDLQERFSRQFEYSVMREKASAGVTCRVSYIPFEARIDRTAFELIVRETKPYHIGLRNWYNVIFTMLAEKQSVLFVYSSSFGPKGVPKPQNIIIINSNAKRAQKVQNFIDQQGLKIKLHYDTQQAQQLSFKTNSAVKQVFLDDTLYLTLPVHQVNNKRYEVSRIRAALDMGSLDNLVLHPSHEQDPSYQRPSLFLRGKDYRIHDLQEYLRHNGVQSVLVEGRLTVVVVGSSGGNEVTVYFDAEGQIRLEGRLSREYFVVRGLIYRHFGRI